ncbi:hypothetical protein H0H81_001594 [Sphagnurus paluster]|uniref:Uncharacterized protein n=1 Tax=Sphagnurus paluster TaxID=117069 RepID=A0A9P7G285_9AGAR|nr:hypothetical protein H0H81_001594 [Sphagnurus paluster]
MAVRLSQILQLLLVFYVSVAVFYTTNQLLVYPLRAGLSLLVNNDHPMSPRSLWQSFSNPSLDPESKRDRKRKEMQMYNLDARFLEFSGGDTEWESSNVALEHGLGNVEPVLIDEELSLSKAFSTSMRPSKIIPYFYRALGNFDNEDITITTLVTSSRLQAFGRLVERYQGTSQDFLYARTNVEYRTGPISVTIHVGNTTSEIRSILKSLKALYAASRSMSIYVDVHLVIDSFDRQLNTWRNIARLFARTDFIMMLDVDFYICTDFRSVIRRSLPTMRRLREGNTAFVIPAFEYVKYADGVDHSVFPKDKRTLLGLVKSKRIGMFHASWAPGHNSTDYKKYYAAPPGEIYKVTQYQSAYEPYVVMKKEGPPWLAVPPEASIIAF